MIKYCETLNENVLLVAMFCFTYHYQAQSQRSCPPVNMDPEQVPAESFPLSEKKNVFEVSLKDLKSNYPDKKNVFFFFSFFF